MNGTQAKQVSDFGIALARMMEASAKDEPITLTDEQNKAMIAMIKVLTSARKKS